MLEQEIGQARHYGIRVRAERVPGRDLPRWLITDPHTGQRDYAFAWYSTDPPPVEVYTRGQYERACAALEITPAADADLGSYGDRWGSYDLFTYTPRQSVTMTLRRRRLAGLLREHAAQLARRCRSRQAEGLDTQAYTRAAYERVIMQVPVLPDAAGAAVVGQYLSRYASIRVVDVGVPDDEATVELCMRRVAAIDRDARAAARRCDECGALILGAGMVASLGLACDALCYDAMADRPGRYATRQQGH